jgi:parallel beta-helix repeat protein
MEIKAQSGMTCNSALPLLSNAYGVENMQTQTDTCIWYQFIAQNPLVNVKLIEFFHTESNKISRITVFSGSCNSLTKIEGDTLLDNHDTVFFCSLNNLTVGQTFYIKIEKIGSNTTPAFYSVVFDYSIAFPSCPIGCPAPSSNPCDLICNGDFEYNVGLPVSGDYSGQIALACPWKKLTDGTPDYFHTSAPGGASNTFWIPTNLPGSEPAFSGNAYGGLAAYYEPNSSVPQTREYMYQQLKCPLIAGARYNLTYRISLGDNSKYKVNLFSAAICPTAPVGTGLGAITLPAGSTVITASSVLTSGWVTVTQNFVALGGENYIIIGNFSSTDPTVAFNPSGSYLGAYYYVDAVTLTPVFPSVITATPNVVCYGNTTTLSNNLNTPLNWSSSPSASLSCSTCPSTSTAPLFSNTLFTGTITYCSGCSQTLTTNVTVTNITADAGNDVDICQGGSTPLNASGGFLYSWQPTTGLSNPNIPNPIASPSATTTYTVSVSNALGGCTMMDFVTVNVNPLPPSPQLSGDLTVCEYNSGIPVTYTILNYNSSYVYSTPVLSPSGYGTVSSVSPSGTFTISWLPSANAITNFTLSVSASDKNGCSNTGTLLLYMCCENTHPGYMTVNNATTSSLPNPYTANLIINGTLTVNNNFSFVTANVILAPGAKIVIPASNPSPVTLRITFNSHLHANCGAMWNSIYVEANQTVWVDNGSRIEDADSAIVSVNGGKYILQNAELNKNYKHIVVKGYSGTHPGIIEKTNFYCRNYPTLTDATLIAPYPPNTRTAIGIDIRDVQSIQVGNDANILLRNNFRNMDIGIRSLRSNLTAYNNYFLNIKNPSPFTACKSCDCNVGTAICAVGTKTPANIITVGGTGNKKNIFSYCDLGLSVKINYHSFVQNNLFSNVYEGVYVTQCPLKIIAIADNAFNNIVNGIDLYENPNAGYVYINNNDINNTLSIGSLTSPPVIANYGILIQNVLQNTNNAFIENNVIKSAKTGIWLINSEQTTVNANTVSYAPAMDVATAKNIGIRLEKSNYGNVVNNAVLKTGAIPSSAVYETRFKGISVENSQNVTVAKNKLTKMGQGIRMQQSCTNSTLACNDLTQCWLGVRFDNADISNQLPFSTPTANKWIANVGSLKLSGNISPAINWYYTPSGTYNLSPVDYSLTTGFTAIATSNPDMCSSFIVPPPDVKRELQLGKIVRNEKAFANSQAEFKQYDKQLAFTELRKNLSLLTLGTVDDTTYQNFYANVINTSTGKFVQVQEQINADNKTAALSVNASVAPNNVLEQNRKTVNEIYLNDFIDMGYVSDSANYYTLEAIAYQDPLLGSDAVYSARAMLRISPEQDETRQMQNNEETINEVYVSYKLYPNPNNGEMILEYNNTTNENAVLSIYNTLGQRVASYNLNRENTLHPINEQSLINGIYFYQITLNDTLIGNGKIVISK